jgi:hypothetical protein
LWTNLSTYVAKCDMYMHSFLTANRNFMHKTKTFIKKDQVDLVGTWIRVLLHWEPWALKKI